MRFDGFAVVVYPADPLRLMSTLLEADTKLFSGSTVPKVR
jgi:hypothetical protein